MGTRLVSWVSAALLIGVVSAEALAAESFADVRYLAGIIPDRLETQRVGEEVVWVHVETGSQGVIIIDREEISVEGWLCRDYRRITERTGADPIVFSGRGCKDDTGRWRVQPEVAAVPPSVPSRDPSPPPLARAEPEPQQPPLEIPPPARKPDPDVFFASVPTPSVY